MIHDQKQEDNPEAVGWCKRHAPYPVQVGSVCVGSETAYWPITLAEDWCGEFRPRHAK